MGCLFNLVRTIDFRRRDESIRAISVTLFWILCFGDHNARCNECFSINITRVDASREKDSSILGGNVLGILVLISRKAVVEFKRFRGDG